MVRFLGVVVLGKNDVPLEFFDRGCTVLYDPVACAKSKRRERSDQFPEATFLGGGYASDKKALQVYVVGKAKETLTIPIWRIYAKEPGATIHKNTLANLEEHIAAVSKPRPLTTTEKSDIDKHQQKQSQQLNAEELNAVRSTQLTMNNALTALTARVQKVEHVLDKKEDKLSKKAQAAEEKSAKQQKEAIAQLKKEVDGLQKTNAKLEAENLKLKRRVDALYDTGAMTIDTPPRPVAKPSPVAEPAPKKVKVKQEPETKHFALTSNRKCEYPHADTFVCCLNCEYL
jgi:hypothetical protein